MPVNLYEQNIQPIVDLDTDVVVYVPGYAIMGPAEPTLVNASTFTSIFGASPYLFSATQTAQVTKNNTHAGRPDKSWLYAKGLVDAGLTVLYHRCNAPNSGTVGTAVTASDTVFTICSSTTTDKKDLKVVTTKSFGAQAKFFGGYYNGLTVTFSVPNKLSGTTTVTVSKGGTPLESKVVSLDPSKSNFIGDENFTYVEFFTGSGATKLMGFESLALGSWLDDNSGNQLYVAKAGGSDLSGVLALANAPADEFNVSSFENILAAGDDASYGVLSDTDRYSAITYITTGGYFQSKPIAGGVQKLANLIKAIALVDLADGVSTAANFETLQSNLLGTGAATIDMSKSAMFVGADTYYIAGYRVVMPDSYGYLLKLASNLSQGIPAWIPVANNPQGVVPAVATTRPVSQEVYRLSQDKSGVSVNPIIYKQNVGFTIMGNRTLYPNTGVLGPQSFLNCQLVVNSVARSARRAASDLLIVSTNPNTAFSTFKLTVSRTCDKMLVNGDGLAAYSIRKLKKTQPATIDIVIDLTVREGIEVFEITIPVSLELD